MHKKPSIKLLFVFGSALFLLDGCVGTSVPKCFSAAPSRGYFCHQGYNFGRHLNTIRKRGIRDGCRTANGYFTKDYTLSSYSIDYTEGWGEGRATCKLIPPSEADIGSMRTQYQQSIDTKRYYGT